MTLEKIVAITGKPGLYEIVSQTKGGLLVQSLIDKKTDGVFRVFLRFIYFLLLITNIKNLVHLFNLYSIIYKLFINI